MQVRCAPKICVGFSNDSAATSLINVPVCNLKKEFARVFRVKSGGMARALEVVGLPLEGTHHREMDDARNIARLAVLILPHLEARRP